MPAELGFITVGYLGPECNNTLRRRGNFASDDKPAGNNFNNGEVTIRSGGTLRSCRVPAESLLS